MPRKRISPPPCGRSPFASSATAGGSGGASTRAWSAAAGMATRIATKAAARTRITLPRDQRVLRDIGRAARESGGAIGEVEAPAADEPLVEPLSAHASDV